MKIEILIGGEAEALIGNAALRKKWKELYDKCPWGSVYQSEDFVLTWYSTYGSQFTPVIVTGTNRKQELVGLFTLAVAKDSGGVTVAGSSQAEYQAWLAKPQDGNVFIDSALEKLCGAFPNESLTLLFMLPTVPIGWTQSGNRWCDHCYVRKLPRGLIEIGDGSSFKDTLRKKKQSKINRLKRSGNLHLDRIQTPEELGAIFDEAISYQTLRLRAVHNLPNMEPDPLKKAFHMKLMSLPRMIHATALRVNHKLVSVQIHKYNKDQLILDLIAHSPLHARYSPGELHLLMVGMELAKEEISIFDLTPGGNYKDRRATHHDDAHIVTVFFNRSHCARYKIKRALVEAAKSALRRFGITPEKTRDSFLTFLDWRLKWLRLKPSDWLSESFRTLKRSVGYRDEVCIYACDLNQTHTWSDSQTMKKDHIADLLAYQPMETWQPPVNRFMKLALRNLEAGHHIYTRVEDGNLVQYGWLIEPQGQKSATAGEQELELPGDAVMLTDFYTHLQGRTLSRSSLCQILFDAGRIPGAKQAYVCVSAGNRGLRQTVEGVGFRYQYSSFRKRTLGKVTTWSTARRPESQASHQLLTAGVDW